MRQLLWIERKGTNFNGAFKDRSELVKDLGPKDSF